MYSDKVTKSVAEAAKKVYEDLKGNQHKLDKNKNNKIDAHDFKLLRVETSYSSMYCDCPGTSYSMTGRPVCERPR